MPETVMVFCAHSDDHILGPGGTLAKLAKEGAKIITVIFSFGERSHPHLKEEIIKKIRVLEAKKADKIIGGSEVLFLGMKETKFMQDAETMHISSKLRKLIHKYNPDKIFLHASDDKDIPSLDHPCVNKIVMPVLDVMNYQGRVYVFEVWNLFNFKNRFEPCHYVDITDEFKKKLQALESFESQHIAMFSLLWSVYVKAIVYGLMNGTRYAERFYIIR
ncbi:MAG: PIG-L deacetylase family protein [Candidatus Woesearchaeota archaeon]